jgi:hypothetical protein
MAGAGHDMAGASMDLHHHACPDCDAEAVDGHAVVAGELPLEAQITEMPAPWSAGSLSQGADPQPPRILAGFL